MHAASSSLDHPSLVLIVEDEPLVRMAAVEMVRDAGFEAMEAADAPVAVRVLEDRVADVCAIFTDIDMPGGMDGLQLVATVCECWPWIALIMTSGHRVAARLTLPERAVFLPKPNREGDVVAELHRLTTPSNP